MSENASDVLSLFHAPVREWFEAVFPAPTRPQRMGWPSIARGESTLILAPTGTGKTLAAFLWCIDRLMFSPPPAPDRRCRILYISPIKALAVDVERNLRAPLVGDRAGGRAAGAWSFTSRRSPSARATRRPAERARFSRHPADILITTPESLYLLLTSNAREALRSIETVIDRRDSRAGSGEARLAPGALAGAAGAFLRAQAAAHRAFGDAAAAGRSRALSGRRRRREGAGSRQPTEQKSCRVEARAAAYRPSPSWTRASRSGWTCASKCRSKTWRGWTNWTSCRAARLRRGRCGRPSGARSIPSCSKLVRAHRSTLIFVNNRRLAERISGAVNDLAGETLVRAHHGSVAAPQRKEIEDRLKMGTLRGLVATSSLELGIDMGAIDLVVQIEAPPSVASGMQRVGRAQPPAWEA